jgi:hypothetical protein
VHHFSCNSASVLVEKTKGLGRRAELPKSLAFSTTWPNAFFGTKIFVAMQGGKKYLELEILYGIAENFAAP